MTTIEAEDVRWDFNGKIIFETDVALAVLIAENVVFLNSHWWREDFSDKDKRLISVNVVCSDIFAWACADAERLPYNEIQNLYELWEKDSDWGPAAWCIKQRKQAPQKLVEDAMTKAGWNVRELYE